MAQILLRLEQSDFEKMSDVVIAADDQLRTQKITAKGRGCVLELQDDCFFATPEKPNGRGWRGDLNCLIEIPGIVKGHKELVPLLYQYSTAVPLKETTTELRRLLYVVDFTLLPAPIIWKGEDILKTLSSEVLKGLPKGFIPPDRTLYYIVDPKAVPKIDRSLTYVSFTAVRGV